MWVQSSLINREPSMGLCSRPIKQHQMVRGIKATTCHLCPMMTLRNISLNLWVRMEIKSYSNRRSFKIRAEIMPMMTNLRRCIQRTARWMRVRCPFLALLNFKRQISSSLTSRMITTVSKCTNQWTNSSREDSWIPTLITYPMAFQWLQCRISIVSIQVRNKWVFLPKKISSPNPGSRSKAKR